MIKINRGPAPLAIKVFSVKCVKALDGATEITRAEQETEKATAFFTDPANFKNNLKLTKKTFTFRVYKNSELAQELERVFGKKCAYCESNFAHVTPREVEHFRPKSEIDTGNGKLRPGYFWLACEWENLLVSCVDCNRARRHEVPGQAAKMKLGKETQFPLSDETIRVRDKGSLVHEEAVRLLLDPCNDEPEEHLTFDIKGLVNARSDGNGQPSAKGEKSITVLALQRKYLVEERLKCLDDFRWAIGQISHLIKIHNTLKAIDATQEELDENLGQIQILTRKLSGMLDRSAPYQAMLREWIREGTKRGDFANLEQFNIRLTDLL